MGDLRDMLLKAGLVSEEQAKKAEAHKQDAEQRAKGRGQPPPRPGRGGGGGGGERGDRRQGHERPRRDEARDTRPPPEPRTASLTPEESTRLFKLAQAGKVEGKTRGQRRWYYVSRSGNVPFLELSDEAARDLGDGHTAIAESERGEVWLVTRDAAEQLIAGDPAWIRSATH